MSAATNPVTVEFLEPYHGEDPPDLYDPFGLDRFIPLKGYSSANAETNPGERYQSGKEPRPGFRWKTESLSRAQALDWLSRGGWLAVPIPVGYTVIDIDDVESADAIVAKYRGTKCGTIRTPKGGQLIFRDTGKAEKARTKRATVGGINVDFRLGGKSYFIVPVGFAACDPARPRLRYWEQRPC